MEYSDFQADFIRNMSIQPAASGIDRISELNTIIRRYVTEWELVNLVPVREMTRNFVAFAERKDRTAAVLKILIPLEDTCNEIRALKEFNGSGFVKVLESDPGQGVMLLKRIIPGNPLSTVQNDQAATLIAARLIRENNARVAYGSGFPHLRDWMARLSDPDLGKLVLDKYRDLQSRSLKVATFLLETMQEEFLLHGDLHHGNILQGIDSWTAIDPKGVIGEKAFDAARFLHNPVPGILQAGNVEKIVLTRAENFAKILDSSVSRILMWGFCLSVLSALWELEDNTPNADYFFEFSAVIEKLIT